jgi:hypothetical protein
VKNVKYEKPEVIALTPAINAIQGTTGSKVLQPANDSTHPEGIGAYEDWE